MKRKFVKSGCECSNTCKSISNNIIKILMLAKYNSSYYKLNIANIYEEFWLPSRLATY
jgi:hypothetical protein